MANPYHDSTGKFCSKGEMRSAIADLATSGKLEEATKLAKELQEIEESNTKAKTLKNIPGPKISEYRASVKTILSKISSRSGSYPTPMGSEEEERTLGQYSDEELEAVEAVAYQEERASKDSLLPLEKEKNEASEKLEAVTGCRQTYEASDVIRNERATAETQGNELVNEIRKEAVSLGLPDKYASYAFSKKKTELGLADTYTIYGTGGRPINVRRSDSPVELTAKTLTPKARDKAHQALMEQAVTNVLDRKSQETQEYNNRVEKINTIEKTLRGPIGDEAYEKSLKYSRARLVAQNYENTRQTVQNHIAWRKTLRSAGVTATTTPYRTAGSVNPGELKVGADGKILNAWVVKRDTEGKRSVARIVDVAPSSDFGNVLVDENGHAHRDLTHYHSYRKQVTTRTVIVDKDIKGPTNPKWAKASFSSTLDTGD